MNALEETLTRRLHATADGVTASWDHAASRVERRARERARRRTTARVGAAVAAGAATVAGLAAVTSSPSGLAPAAGPSTVAVPGVPTAPRYVLGGRTPVHASSDVGAGEPSAMLTFTVYRRPGASGPADPYVMAVTATTKEYSVADGQLQEHGDHRSIGWTVGGQVIDVRSFGVPADDLGRLAPQLKDRLGALPAEIDGWERAAVRGQQTARYDSITYDSAAPDGTIEIHNITGDDVACFVDDRLSQPHTVGRVTAAGHDAVLVDVSNETSTRFWVLWHDNEGITELDIEGVPRDQVDSILANVVSLDAEGYEALFPIPSTAVTAGP